MDSCIAICLQARWEYGKFEFAKEFAKMALCLGEPNCKACIQFEGGNNPDFTIIAPDGNSIKIEQIRMLQSKVIEKPIISKKKVYIIDDSQTMTVEAQNCLLKTLEEPPEYVMIILVCNNENKLLTTIKSRCTKIVFHKIEENILREFLQKQQMSEKILKASDGSIGRAHLIKEQEELLNQVDSAFENIKQKDQIDFIKGGTVFYNKTVNVFDLLDYTNIILLDKAKQDISYINTISKIEEAKNRLKQNGNLEMTIDNMLLSIWEEIHENHSRS